MGQFTLGGIKYTQSAISNTVYPQKLSEIGLFTLDQMYTHTHAHTHTRTNCALWMAQLTLGGKKYTQPAISNTVYHAKTQRNGAIHPRSHVHTHTHQRAHARTHARTHAHAPTHTHTHTRAHTHTQTMHYRRRLSPWEA